MRLAFSVVAAGLLLGPALRAQTIDQQNASVTPSMGFALVQYWTGQTFRPTSNTITGAGVYLENWYVAGPQSGVLSAELWTGVRGTSGSTMLASGSTPFTTGASASGPAGGAWFDVFWPAVSVNPGQEYFLVFNSDYQGQVLNTYTSGDAYTAGGIYFSPSPDGSYYDYPNYGYDLNFREYSAGAVVPTPEPTSVVLLATGLVGIYGAARRKRTRATA